MLGAARVVARGCAPTGSECGLPGSAVPHIATIRIAPALVLVAVQQAGGHMPVSACPGVPSQPWSCNRPHYTHRGPSHPLSCGAHHHVCAAARARLPAHAMALSPLLTCGWGKRMHALAPALCVDVSHVLHAGLAYSPAETTVCAVACNTHTHMHAFHAPLCAHTRPHLTHMRARAHQHMISSKHMHTRLIKPRRPSPQSRRAPRAAGP